MEAKQQELQGTPALIGAPTVLGSPFPTSVLQFPNSAVLPLAAPSSVGNVLPLSLFSQPLLPSLQQQLPMQADPVLLVPASTLSLSESSSFVTSSQLLSTKLQPSPFLQYNQQLLLNNTQIPLVLKSPVHQTQQANPPLIVLPVSGGKGNGESLQPAEETAIPKTSAEGNKAHLSSKGQTANKRKVLKGKKSTSKSNCCTKPSEIDKNNVSAMRSRHHSGESKNAVAVKSNQSADHSSVPAKSESDSTNSIRSLDLSQIISNLPSGWQIVGVTDLNLEQNLPRTGVTTISPSTTLPSASSSNHSLLESGNISVKSDAITTDVKHTPDQPSVVSVNLNMSKPMTSETAFDQGSVNELTCSVKLDDIPCTHVISIKTECMESDEDEKQPDSTTGDPEHVESKDIVTDPAADTSSVSRDLKSSESSAVSASAMSSNFSQSDLQHLSPAPSVTSVSAMADSKWTVVGFTSLPPTPVTTTVTVSQTSMTSSVQPTIKVESCDLPDTKTTTPNTIILKIPVCPTAAPSLTTDKTVVSSQKTTAVKTRGRSLASLLKQEKNSECSIGKGKVDDMKWTVVGVMGSSVTESSAQIQNIIPTSSFSILTPTSSSISGVSLSSPALQSLLSSASSGNFGSRQLWNIAESVTSTQAIVSTANSSSSQSLISKTVGKRKPDILETGKTSSASSVASSPSRDGTSPGISSLQGQTQNQWKIVGITPIGIPSPAPSPIASIPQFSPLNPVGAMPFLISASSNSAFPNLTSTNCSLLSTQTARAAPPPSLISAISSPNISSLLSSNPSPSSSTSSSPFPIVSLGGNPDNTSVILSAPPTVVPSQSPANLQTLQDLIQQQNLSQLIYSQLAAFQNPVNMLPLNEPSQWNVVGLMANNQISLLNQTAGNSVIMNSPSMIPAVSPGSTADSTQSSSTAPASPASLSKENLDSNDTREKTASTQGTVCEYSFPNKKCAKGNYKFHRFKGPSQSKRRHDPEKMKKNTVSNLLKMKRMQQRTSENGSSEDRDLSLGECQDVCEPSHELPVPEKKAKIRSLRSYAGNRKLFTKSKNQGADEKISLRSGTQIPVPHYQSEDDEIANSSLRNIAEGEAQSVSDVNASEEAKVDEIENTPVKSETHSAARKRKLKVPRRMIADLDYHPFDSSSDSN